MENNGKETLFRKSWLIYMFHAEPCRFIDYMTVIHLIDDFSG